ncbi:MAG: hypothetical protein ABL888_12460 [Pirellulaceae bacterium]
MIRPRKNHSLSYSRLENRQLLAVDFAINSLNVSTLVISNELGGENSADEIVVKDVGTHYAMTITSGDTFSGSEIDDMLYTDPVKDTLYVSKQLFAEGIVHGLAFDLRDTLKTDIHFLEAVDFRLIKSPLNFFTEGNITQSGPLAANDLKLIAENVFLEDSGNQFGTIERTVDSSIVTYVFAIAQSGTMNVQGAQAETLIHLSADKIQLNGLAKTGRNALLQAPGGIEQGPDGELMVAGLVVESGTDVNLPNPNNTVRFISGHVSGDLNLGIDSSMRVSRIKPAIWEWDSLTVLGDLSISSQNDATVLQAADAAIAVVGASVFELGEGSVYLSGGDTNGDQINDNNFNVVKAVANNVEIVDFNNLGVAEINAEGRTWLAAGTGGAGRLTLEGEVVSKFALLLQASSGIVQNQGSLNTFSLMIGGDQEEESSGNVLLTSEANVFEQLSTRLRVGSAQLVSTSAVMLTDASFDSTDSGLVESLEGVRVPGHFSLKADNIFDTADADLLVGRDLMLKSAHQIVLGDDAQNTIIGGRFSTLEAGEAIDLGSAGVASLRYVNLNAVDQVVVNQFGDLTLMGVNTSKSFQLTSAGSLTSLEGTRLTATLPSRFQAADRIALAETVDRGLTLGDAHFLAANEITIGGFANARIGRTRFESDGLVNIAQEGFLNLLGQNRAGSLSLFSSSVIRDAANATLEVTGTTTLRASRGVSLADSASNHYHLCGAVEFNVVDYALMHQSGMVMISSHTVRDGAFANLSIDSYDC